ncbi:MAG: guanylate kinase [Cyclobacteriaceae bacterium]|jgi:guanylate kinase
MPHVGKAFIFSAPSGSGKTTVVRHLLKTFPELSFSVSATTRAPRGAEQDAVDYYFLSLEEFKSKMATDELLEWEEVYDGRYYGTLLEEVERIWSAGKHVVFDVDVEGGINLKKKLGDQALSIFIKVTDLHTLRNRLEGRDTDSEEEIIRRVEKAVLEIRFESEFDEVIVNDELSSTLVTAEKLISRFINS